MPAHVLRSAFRHFRKNKTFSLLNIFGLAIGIACAGLIFLWVEDEKSFDNAHIKKDRLYAIEVSMPGEGFTIGSTPRPMASAIKAEIPGIVNTARISDENRNILVRAGDKSLYASGRYTDSSLFGMLTLPFVEGDPRTAFSNIYSIVLTEKAARKFFGQDRNILGKTLRVDNQQDYTVTGLLKDLPANSSLQVEWLAPFAIDLQKQTNPGYWGSYGPLTYVELDARTDPAAVDKLLHDYIRQKDPTQLVHAFLFPMKDWRLYDEMENGKPTGSGRIRYVRMLSGIAWIILLMACINFMNLATARSQQRAREIGVHKVLGAARASLVFRFLLDALFLSALAGILALLIMVLALPGFNLLVEKTLSPGLGSAIHWIAWLAILLITGLIAGSYPSLYLSSFNPIAVLKGLKIQEGRSVWVRKGLVVLQFTVSLIFIIATITIYRQIQFVKNRNLGFDRNRLLEIDMQHDLAGRFPVLRDDLLRTGLVDQVAQSDHPTLYGGNTDDRFDWPGKAPGTKIGMAKRNVSPGFVATTGLHLVSGRDFKETETGGSSNVLITESLARLMDNTGPSSGSPANSPANLPAGPSINSQGATYENIPGRIIRLPENIGNDEKTVTKNFTVIGVLRDFVYGDMHGTPPPVVFFCRPPGQWGDNLIYVRTRAGNDPAGVLAKIQSVVKRDNPAYPFQYKFVDDQFNAMFIDESRMGQLAKVFALLAIFISCLGLFGLAAYTAERRTREIGIRKVLGAGVTGLTALLSKDFMKLVAGSCLLSFPVSWWLMHDWLKNFQYRIGLEAWIFIVAGTGALLIAWFTISAQAIRAALANPVKSLRSE